MAKQTVFLNNFARKTCTEIAISEAVCFLNSTLLEVWCDLCNYLQESFKFLLKAVDDMINLVKNEFINCQRKSIYQFLISKL